MRASSLSDVRSVLMPVAVRITCKRTCYGILMRNHSCAMTVAKPINQRLPWGGTSVPTKMENSSSVTSEYWVVFWIFFFDSKARKHGWVIKKLASWSCGFRFTPTSEHIDQRFSIIIQKWPNLLSCGFDRKLFPGKVIVCYGRQETNSNALNNVDALLQSLFDINTRVHPHTLTYAISYVQFPSTNLFKRL